MSQKSFNFFCKDGILTRPHLVVYGPVTITSNTVKSTDKLLSIYLSLTYILIPFNAYTLTTTTLYIPLVACSLESHRLESTPWSCLFA
jgi:hypothetical protein